MDGLQHQCCCEATHGQSLWYCCQSARHAPLLCPTHHERQRAQLVKELDGEQILEEAPITWELDRAYDLSLRVVGNRIQAFVDQQMVFDVRDENSPLESGAIGLICQEGRVDCDAVSVRPAN